MDIRQAIGDQLHRHRTRRGWSQRVLADKAGISREYLARLEGGGHEPTLTTLRRLAKALGVPLTELLR